MDVVFRAALQVWRPEVLRCSGGFVSPNRGGRAWVRRALGVTGWGVWDGHAFLVIRTCYGLYLSMSCCAMARKLRYAGCTDRYFHDRVCNGQAE